MADQRTPREIIQAIWDHPKTRETELADTILAALAAAGFAVVPREPAAHQLADDVATLASIIETICRDGYKPTSAAEAGAIADRWHRTPAVAPAAACPVVGTDSEKDA